MSSKRLIKNIFKWHQITGIIAACFLLFMGVTGSILVFHEEIDNIQNSDIRIEQSAHLKLDKVASTLLKNYKDWDIRIMHFENQNALPVLVQARRPDERRNLVLHPESGKILKDLPALSYFGNWLLKLHYTLFGKTIGKIAVLLFGVLFTISLLTGFVVYRKSILRVLLFKTQLNLSKRKGRWSRVHRIVGVWSLLFNFTIALTGTLIAISVVDNALNIKTQLRPETPQHVFSLTKTLAEINQRYPNFKPLVIRLPQNTSGTTTVYGKLKNELPFITKYANKIYVEPNSGKITSTDFSIDASFTELFNSSLIPLHFGNWGGIFMKLLYCIFGLAPPILSISGFYLWRKRQKKQ